MRLLTIALLLALTSCTYHYHYHAVEKVPTYRLLPNYNPQGWFENVPSWPSPRTTLDGILYHDGDGRIGIGKPPKFMLNIDTLRVNSTDSVGMYTKPTSRIIITPHIDAGIGTTNPTHKLSVKGVKIDTIKVNSKVGLNDNEPKFELRVGTSIYDGPGSKNIGKPAPKYQLDVRPTTIVIGTSHMLDVRGVTIDTTITPR